MADPAGPHEDFAKFHKIFRNRAEEYFLALDGQDFGMLTSSPYSLAEADAYGAPKSDKLEADILQKTKEGIDKNSSAAMFQQLALMQGFKRMLSSKSRRRNEAYALWWARAEDDLIRADQVVADLGLVTSRRAGRYTE